MAFFEMHYHSDALKSAVTVNVVLPESAKTMIGMKADGGSNYKTLYLLHGLSDDQTTWMRRTSIERYAAEYGVAVVMPNGGRSWYTDTADGAAYLTFVGEELPHACRGFFRGMSERREDTWIGGLSMGGYGAIKTALTYPDRFGGCVSLSGALDIADFCQRVKLCEWQGIFGFSLQSGEELRGSQHDVYNLSRKNHEAGTPFPRLYMWCGESDSLLKDNRAFHELMKELSVPHQYEESEGDHSWKWWDLHIQNALRYLSDK
ncbi:MAG: esterase family protein [Clostridia bacterium]|nr:esterase family protein [Clostridia bacterium]